MAGGVGTPVSEDVAAQIAARKASIGKKVGKSAADLLYANAKTGWIKLSSSVNTLSSQEIASLRAGTDPATINGDATLAGHNILLGGLLRPDRGLRRGIETPSNQSDRQSDTYAYQNRAASTGIRPMPGITSMTVKSKNTYGTLREADVKFSVWTLEDFEIMEQVYLRPGFTVMLEWGHSMYIDNSGALNKDIETIGNHFFNPNVTMSQLLKEIAGIRKNTSNNYEGMVGYVKNFSWNYNSNGGYECSVTIISTGEILESLQLRFDPAQRGAIMEDKDTEKGKEQRKSIYHYIIDKMSIIGNVSFGIPRLKEEIGTLADNLKTDYVMYYQKVQLDDGWFLDTDTPMHWIPLRLYLDIFNQLISPVDKTKPKGSPDRTLTRFNVDYEKSSTFLTSPEHFSVDPTVCVKAAAAELSTGERIEVRNPHTLTAPTGGVDDVLNIYISTPYLKSVLDGALDEKGKLNKSFHDITTTVLEGINTSFGGINDLGLAYSDEDEGGTWYIIDRNNTPETAANHPTFTLAGIESVFTDVSISSKISNEIGAQISIAAQGSASGTGEYVENILRWNPGTVDRIKTVKTTVDKGEAEAAADAKKEQQERTAEWLTDVLEVFGKVNSIDGYKKEDMEAIKTMHAEWTVENVVKKYRIKNKGALPGLVPVELSFKLDGIGGFIVGQAFKIGAGLLPSKYQDRFGYIITGLEHIIGGDNRWETSVTTQFYSIETPSDVEAAAAGVIPAVTARQKANNEANKKRDPNFTPSKTKGGTSRVIEGVKYKNGELPDDKLRYIKNWKNYVGSIQSDDSRIRLYPAASRALDKLLAAAEANKENGKAKPIKFKINAAFRTYTDQVRVRRDYPSNSATPGTSNHGFGLAVDFSFPGSFGAITVGSAQYNWLIKNAATYGFKRLPWQGKVSKSGKPLTESWESWHWEYQI